MWQWQCLDCARLCAYESWCRSIFPAAVQKKCICQFIFDSIRSKHFIHHTWMTMKRSSNQLVDLKVNTSSDDPCVLHFIIIIVCLLIECSHQFHVALILFLSYFQMEILANFNRCRSPASTTQKLKGALPEKRIYYVCTVYLLNFQAVKSNFFLNRQHIRGKLNGSMCTHQMFGSFFHFWTNTFHCICRNETNLISIKFHIWWANTRRKINYYDVEAMKWLEYRINLSISFYRLLL